MLVDAVLSNVCIWWELARMMERTVIFFNTNNETHCMSLLEIAFEKAYNLPLRRRWLSIDGQTEVVVEYRDSRSIRQGDTGRL